MSDAAMKRVEELILAAVPAYEMYLLQVMGKPYHMKPPLFRVNSEKLRVTFDSVEHAHGAQQSPDRLVMFIELNRAMGSSTITTEYWQDTKATEPTARGEAKVEATPENLMAPAFAFGWLSKLVGGWSEGIDDMANIEDVRMEQAEQLIVKADEILGELGYVLEAESYESYANTLDNFLLTAQLDEQVEGILSKVGNVVRKAAHAYGAAKGGIKGAKDRWSAFKGSVKAAFSAGHEKGYKATRGEPEKPEKGKGAEAPTGKAKLKLVKGGKSGKKHPGGKMTDKEYKARYGKPRKIASSLETPMNDLDEMMNGLRDSYYEAEFNSLNVEELLVLERMLALDEGGEKFAALAKKLGKRGGVKDPAALAAWIGREKYGKEKFQKKAVAGKKEDREGGVHGHWGTPSEALSSYQKLSGLAMPMQSWSLPKLK